MREVYITQTNCITPLGFDVSSNIEAIISGKSGIEQHEDLSLMPNPFYASIINEEKLSTAFAKVSSKTNYSRLEKMMIFC